MTTLRALQWLFILGIAGAAYSDEKADTKGHEHFISKSPEGAAVFIIKPLDGEKFKSDESIDILFGLRGMGVAPAGVQVDNTGHHHLLINVDSIDFNISIPASDNHIHFGGGQTETVLDLLPGEYTLQLLLGDMYHVPHDPPVLSNKISLIVTD